MSKEQPRVNYGPKGLQVEEADNAMRAAMRIATLEKQAKEQSLSDSTGTAQTPSPECG